MEEKIERSEELRNRIIKDEKLLRDLSEIISEILNGKVKIGEDETYGFVPLVYKKPIFAPEIFASAVPIEKIPFGGAGPLDPEIAVLLEKFRLMDGPIKDDPIPLVKPKSFREQILRNKVLLKELSEGISKVLKEHGVAFENDETYAFMPVVFKKAIFGPELFSSSPVPQPVPAPDVYLVSPVPQPPNYPAFLARISTIAMIETFGIIPKPFPGPLDPELLNVIEKYRI